MNNLYNNDIVSLEYTGTLFLQVTVGLAIWWFIVENIYNKYQLKAEEEAKLRNNE